MERMINNRLYDYLDMHGMMVAVQCGCRRKRSTIDHLVRLETMMHRAFAHGERVSVFFLSQESLRHGVETRYHARFVQPLFAWEIASVYSIVPAR